MIINGIDPLQPYFVLNTRLYWKMRLVNSPVAHFYQFTCTEKNPVINGVVPDGAVDVIVDTDTGWSSVSGSVKSVIEAPFEQGHTYFGAINPVLLNITVVFPHQSLSGRVCRCQTL